MAKEFKYVKISRNILENGKIICFMAMENIIGQMAGNMWAIGSKINSTAKAHSHGMTADSTQVNMQMIKNQAKVCINGPMANLSMVNGQKESNMVKQ